MARRKLRSRREVVERVGELSVALADGLERRGNAREDPSLSDALWGAEGLGTLLWALELVAFPPYDRVFDPAGLLGARLRAAKLRNRVEIEHARESARLWHWRARTALLGAADGLELPPGWQSFEQLIAVAALRGHERGLLPAPLRGDFPAYGTGYRGLPREQQLETLSIAYERHRALNWLCLTRSDWAQTPVDT